MVRRDTRRGRRVLVIDFCYVKPDGTNGRYRRDATVQELGAELPVAPERVLMMRDGQNRAQLPGATDFDAVIDAAPAHNPEQTKAQSIHDPFVIRS